MENASVKTTFGNNNTSTKAFSRKKGNVGLLKSNNVNEGHEVVFFREVEILRNNIDVKSIVMLQFNVF